MTVVGDQVSGEVVAPEPPVEEEQSYAPPKRRTNRAWWLVVPVVVSVAFTAVIPLMTVVNYSVQDVFSPVDRVFVGLEWFRAIARDPEVHAALVRTLLFSLQVLLLEIPLGVALAVVMPRRGMGVSLALVLVALPLLIPWNVVGTIWQIFARGDIGLGGWTINNVLGINFNYTLDSTDAWITVLLMDVWHWTPLVALLAYAGLRSIPEPYFQAAQIDGASAWATFRHIQLPRLRGVLTIAILLRFMDSLMIYTEPFVVTGGGPGNATSFLSILLSKIAVGQFDVGPAAAFSLLYFLIVQVICYVFFTVLTRSGR
ncbi:carbohydrate ABC transporter permease [Nonomuraea gerenzanensis]|uniref:Glycerol-3-phosphate ABC transporter, permease protein UgpA (TC 3.A.1.1.3) n=1 Tax=Nonomuraea gerenzanensis TaxID=93944 RepID=A0A1M4E1M5_9ACTN|nr:sugar ABC transporter permease [Nonomuraea gerenzanensis]UBU14994.1 sugar ABC transporter permease [Nonomuraea gerenzanensis]SBO92734.1 Glycerol-3-phosphate ABC transporter, permease protein UgpA (TC 3.A.1.1.3) [Nonomuraea gerenzanensis]